MTSKQVHNTTIFKTASVCYYSWAEQLTKIKIYYCHYCTLSKKWFKKQLSRQTAQTHSNGISVAFCTIIRQTQYALVTAEHAITDLPRNSTARWKFFSSIACCTAFVCNRTKHSETTAPVHKLSNDMNWKT